MNTLLVEASEFSPKVLFDVGTYNFTISGISRPENVSEFYVPLLNWLDEFTNEFFSNHDYKSIKLTFNFKLVYLNSSSSKYVLDILERINNIKLNSAKIEVNWFYEEGDEDIMEVGEELSKAANLHFTFIEDK